MPGGPRAARFFARRVGQAGDHKGGAKRRAPLRSKWTFSRRGDSRIARRHAPMSDKRAVEGASPYAATLPPLKGEVSPALAPVTEGCLPRPHRVIANQ